MLRFCKIKLPFIACKSLEMSVFVEPGLLSKNNKTMVFSIIFSGAKKH
jgi:hypothetical protein